MESVQERKSAPYKGKTNTILREHLGGVTPLLSGRMHTATSSRHPPRRLRYTPSNGYFTEVTMEAFWRDLRTALRRLRKSPGFALAGHRIAGARHRRQYRNLQPVKRIAIFDRFQYVTHHGW